MEFVHCTEVVRFSESPLLEVSLYINHDGGGHSSSIGACMCSRGACSSFVVAKEVVNYHEVAEAGS